MGSENTSIGNSGQDAAVKYDRDDGAEAPTIREGHKVQGGKGLPDSGCSTVVDQSSERSYDATHDIASNTGICGTRQVWGQTKNFGRFGGHDATGTKMGDYRQGHSFLQFPDMLEETPRYRSRRDELCTRPVLDAIHLDRCWDKLMATTNDVVYKEIVLEFLSTCRYTPASDELMAMIPADLIQAGRGE
ncbi:hypothetical protein L1887_32053 [Cichorium endivia]|nr:hypothetical protein L1887_32053 [Cichorium endivia]